MAKAVSQQKYADLAPEKITLTSSEEEWLVKLATCWENTVYVHERHDTRALNGLVRKTMAAFDDERKCWSITARGRIRTTTIY